MRVAAVVICLWSRYRGRKPFYAVEWGNDRLCREMADTVIMAGRGRRFPVLSDLEGAVFALGAVTI